MSRYIDADDITKKIQSRIKYFEMYYPNDMKNIYELYNCLEIVNDIPTAEVKPIVYGEWIVFGKQGGIPISYVCSNCEWHWTNNKFRFCPNCGADMREESREEQ